MGNEIELSDKEKALQYAMYAMASSYFENSKESIKVASPYREASLRTSFTCTKRDIQTAYEESAIKYIEEYILEKDIDEEMLKDHATVKFEQYLNPDGTVLVVSFDAYFWKLDFRATMNKGRFYFSHTVTKMEDDTEQ